MVATQATRTAINCHEFLSMIHQHTGWTVRLLGKEEEGCYGGWGVASSLRNPRGLVIELGGGSIQMHWLEIIDGVLQPTTSPVPISLPYGAAAVKKRLEEAEATGSGASQALRDEIKSQFSKTIATLQVRALNTEHLRDTGKELRLYLTGGGFRGWGFLLMHHHKINPYPIATINGFEVDKAQFLPSAINIDFNDTTSLHTSFRLGGRRMSQMPAIVLIIETLNEVLPEIDHIHFAQGGIREGLIFADLPPNIRAQHPLTTATLPWAPIDSAGMLQALIEGMPQVRAGDHPVSLPEFVTCPGFLYPFINLLNHHALQNRNSRASSALRSTTTGVLVNAHGLLHWEQALLAIALCERWENEIPAAEVEFRTNLMRLVGPERAWWAQYVGIIGKAIGDAYPAGVMRSERVRLSAFFTHIGDKLVVEVRGATHGAYMGSLQWMEPLRKLGKKKGAVDGFRVKTLVIHDQTI